MTKVVNSTALYALAHHRIHVWAPTDLSPITLRGLYADLIENGLLVRERANEMPDGWAYYLTPRGKAYIEACLNLEIPDVP